MNYVAFALLMNQSTISSDPRLAKVVDFDRSLTPITRFVQDASADLGVTLAVSPEVANMKVDVFVTSQPVGKVLENAANVLNCNWVADGNGYKLTLDPNYATHESEYFKEENRLAIKYVNKEISINRLMSVLVRRSDKTWPEIAKTPNRFADWKNSRDSARHEIEATIVKRLIEDQLIELDIQLEASDRLFQGDPNLKMARMFSQMTPQDIDAFKSGATYVVSNLPGSKFSFTTGDVPPDQLEQDASGKVVPKKIVLVARLDGQTHRIVYREFVIDSRGVTTGRNSYPSFPQDSVPVYLRKLPFAAGLREWDKTKEFETLFEAKLDTKQAQAKPWEPEWKNDKFRLGDHLRWFHKATGVPIVADADRNSHLIGRLGQPAYNQGQYLLSLIRTCDGFATKKENFLLVRNGLFWRRRKAEVPENLLTKLETPPAEKPATLWDFVGLAKQVNTTQSVLLGNQDTGFVTKFSSLPFRDAAPALNFLGKLTPAQVNLASSATGLPVKQLTPALQFELKNALILGIVTNANSSPAYLSQLATKGTLNLDVASLTFKVARGVKGGAYANEFVLQPDGTKVVNQKYREFNAAKFDFTSPTGTVVSFMSEDP